MEQKTVRARRSKVQKKTEEEVPEAPPPPKTKTEAHDAAIAEIDALLDEIDLVLEHDAQEFVRSYVQHGGQAIRVLLEKVIQWIDGPNILPRLWS